MIRIFFLVPIFIFTILTASLATPKLNVKSAIVIDYNSNKVLYEIEPDTHIYPASMTKIMTSIIAFDLLKQGKINLDD